MADYRAGLLKPGRRRYDSSSKPAALLLCRVVGDVEPLAKALRAKDWRVAFCCPASAEATRFAQASGCRYYPFDSSDPDVRARIDSDLHSRWGEDVRVADVTSVPCPMDEATLAELLEKVEAASGESQK